MDLREMNRLAARDVIGFNATPRCSWKALAC